MARISTHVLDITRGTPAHGIAVELHFVKGGERRLIAAATTNADGRTDAPTDPPFMGVIIIRIGVASSADNYHVPLLVSPYGYSTYRGS